MENSPKTQPRILVPVDFSSQQDAVVARAIRLAARMDGELILFHCASPVELSMVAIEPVYVPALVMERFVSDHLQAASAKLADLSQSLRAPGPVQTMVKSTTPFEGIVTAADELDCDCIVMGSHGAGLDRFLLGSVAESVAAAAPCPVVIQRDTEEVEAIDSVLVGIDFSVYSSPLVELARNLAGETGKIHLLHCWQPPHLDTLHVFGDPGHAGLVSALTEGMQLHSRELERFASDLPDDERYCLHVETGRAAQTLLDAYDEYGVQAVLVGAHNAETSESLLGSVSDRVLRHAKTTVVLTEAARARWAAPPL